MNRKGGQEFKSMKKIKLDSKNGFKFFLLLILFTFLLTGIFLIFRIFQNKKIVQTVEGSLLVVSNLKSENVVDVVNNQNKEKIAEVTENKNNENIVETNENKNSSIFLEADKTKIQIQDQVQVSINTSKIPIAACTINLYFDSNKLEVINIPENANVIEDEIIYTWYDNRTEKIEQKILH